MSGKKRRTSNLGDKVSQSSLTKKRRSSDERGVTRLEPDYLVPSHESIHQPQTAVKRQATLLYLQRTLGNASVQRLILKERIEDRTRPATTIVSDWGKHRPHGTGERSSRIQRSFSPKSARVVQADHGVLYRRPVQWGKHRQEKIPHATNPGISAKDLGTTRSRVAKLKNSSRVLRKLANLPVPTKLSGKEVLMEKRFSNWLGHSSQKLDMLARQGSSILKAMTIGNSTKRVNQDLTIQQMVQRRTEESLPQRWASGSGSSLSSWGNGTGTNSTLDNMTSTSDSTGALMDATKQMQEMNQSFNLQYLQLQQNMQQENRQFTMMSNIMKTKHDTAKSAINNIR